MNPEQGRTTQGPVDDVGTTPRYFYDLIPTLLFVGAVVSLAFWWLIATRHWILQFEDFRLIDSGLTPKGILMPYNDHLSVVPLAAYQIMARMFGTGVTLPFAVVALAAHLAVPVSLFVMARRRIGSTFALLMGLSMLFYPNAVLLVASFNHFLAFVSIVVCAWLLAEYPERRHLALAGV